MRAKRVDANHREIVTELRKLGWLVLDLSGVGKGCPDLLCARGPRVALVEVKTPKGKLTPAQQARIGSGWPVTVVRSVDDVVKLTMG